MTNRIAHKTRIHLNNRQKNWMLQNCNVGIFAYNYAIKCFNDNDGYPNAMNIRKLWIRERDTLYPWLKEQKLNNSAINDVINVNFSAAMNQWKKSGYTKDKVPRFHKMSRQKSITFSYISIKLEHVNGKTLKLPNKMGTARLAEPIRFKGKLKQSTFSFEGGKWYVSFLIDPDEMPKPDPAPTNTYIGIDVGVKQFAVLSDGTKHIRHDILKSYEISLKREQRKLSNMQGPIKAKRKGSKNWKKQKTKVSRLTKKIANVRKNYIEHVTLDIAQKHSNVAIEDLKIKNMTASAKGDIDNPGKNVKAKSGLNKSLLDNGLYIFRTRLEAKVNAREGNVIAVDPKYTSQTCNNCGHVCKENRKSRDEFECVECGYTNDADINAAINIHNKAFNME